MFSLAKSFYVGEFERSLDDKCRLSLPLKWRPADEGELPAFLALPNPVGCITVYPPKMIARLEEKVSQVSLGDQVGQQALARLFSQADTFDCDAKGRMKLEERLVRHAEIHGDVLLVGSYATFHIWNPEKFRAYLGRPITQKDEMSLILKSIGL
jgi:MraZ protein